MPKFQCPRCLIIDDQPYARDWEHRCPKTRQMVRGKLVSDAVARDAEDAMYADAAPMIQSQGKR